MCQIRLNLHIRNNKEFFLHSEKMKLFSEICLESPCMP